VVVDAFPHAAAIPVYDNLTSGAKLAAGMTKVAVVAPKRETARVTHKRVATIEGPFGVVGSARYRAIASKARAFRPNPRDCAHAQRTTGEGKWAIDSVRPKRHICDLC